MQKWKLSQWRRWRIIKGKRVRVERGFFHGWGRQEGKKKGKSVELIRVRDNATRVMLCPIGETVSVESRRRSWQAWQRKATVDLCQGVAIRRSYQTFPPRGNYFTLPTLMTISRGHWDNHSCHSYIDYLLLKSGDQPTLTNTLII